MNDGEKDVVIGLDSSTQSTKAIAWSRSGEPLVEGRAQISLNSPEPGYQEQDPEEWWTSARDALRETTAAIDPRRIAGIAISNQRETVAFVDAEGRPSRPAIVWLDERARDELALLSDEFGAERLHRISGKPADLTPVVYRLSWLKRHRPEELARATKILDVHGYLTLRLTGRATASWTSADPFGIFDIERKEWSAPVLAHLGLGPERLAELARSGSPVGAVTEAAALATGLPPGTAVFAAGGDGQCAGLGVNAVRPGAVYLNLGTALIAGAWSRDPLIGRFWRTMTSPTGDGYFLEGVQRAGAFFINWLIDTFAGGREDPEAFDRLEAQATTLPIGAEGVTICPYLTGCMDPHWDANARASISGLGPMHGPGHLYRAALEALTLETARCLLAMRENGVAAERIVAVGGGSKSALWTQMLADASGLPLVRGASPEASALGAGVSAAVGAGWYDSFDTAAAAMSRESAAVTPDRSTAQAWAALSERQAKTYRPELGVR